MDFFIARQPIFSVSHKLFAYELLYRGYKSCQLPDVDGNKATSSVLTSVFLTEGIKAISGTKPCFINFTEELLLRKIAYTFPKNQLIIEILEDVNPTKEVLQEIRTLKSMGYTIVLDDFVYQKKLEPMIVLADIIKIDVRLTPIDTILKMLNYLKRFNVKLLAEKVETKGEYEKAINLGFQYFQGYYFSKPQKLLVKEIPMTKIGLFTLMAEITRKSTSLERLHTIISKDISVSYKLLRFLNSAYFYRLEKVKSVKHAIAYLGEKELRRFLLLVTISKLAEEKPTELIRHSLVRAKFCELLGKHSMLFDYQSELFLVGLFSFIDALLDTDIKIIMEKLPVTDAVYKALVERKGVLSPFVDAMTAYERRQEKVFLTTINELDIDSEIVPELYMRAVSYSNGLV